MPTPQMVPKLNTAQPQAQAPQKPNVAGFIQAARSQGVSDKDIYAHLQQKGIVKPQQDTQPSGGGSVLGAIKGATEGVLGGGVDNIKNAAKAGVEKVKEGVKQTANAKTPADIVEGPLKAGAGAVETVLSPTAAPMKPVSDLIGKYADTMGNNKTIQKFAMSPAGETTSRVVGDINNANELAGTVAGGMKAPEAKASIKSAFEESATPKEPPPPGPDAPPVRDAKLKAVDEDWSKPATVNMPGYAKPKAILEKNPGIASFLTDHGLNPYQHIVDERYSTGDAGSALRDTGAKMSHDTLRPSLHLADYTTPKTTVAEAAHDAIRNVMSDSELTEGAKVKATNHINDEADALSKKYEGGMGLENMHDEKITYAKNSGYSPIKDPATNIMASANRAFASALQNLVEKKAPPEIPVGDFNAHISKYYKAADYLDSIDGKKAPPSVAQTVARTAAKFGGAALARHLVPGAGELVSSFAGYQMGKALEHAIENMTNPMRDSFLRNLKVTNPEAFTKVASYIGDQEASRATRLALPEGKAPGTPENPWKVAPKEKSGVKVVPAQKGEPGRAPKGSEDGGQYFRTYTSNPDE